MGSVNVKAVLVGGDNVMFGRAPVVAKGIGEMMILER